MGGDQSLDWVVLAWACLDLFLSSALSCNASQWPVEGAVPYALAQSPLSATAGSNTCSPHVFLCKRRKWARLSNFVALFQSASLPLWLSWKKKNTLTKATFFLNSPHLSLFTSHFLSLSALLFHAMIVYISLYYTHAAGSERWSEGTETSPGVRMQETQGNLFTSLHYATPSHMPSPRSI